MSTPAAIEILTLLTPVRGEEICACSATVSTTATPSNPYLKPMFPIAIDEQIGASNGSITSVRNSRCFAQSITGPGAR